MNKILLVGTGKMGGALLKKWEENLSQVISTLDPHNPNADYQSATDITTPFDTIVLAVKPQIMGDVVEGLKPIITPATLILSIAAGKTIAFYEGLLGPDQPIIRVMPNTPALIGKGMSVLCGNAATTEMQCQLAMNLLDSVGDTEWIDDEGFMDAVTAVSGSGPAYVFHLIEAMTAAGIAAGLSPALSTKLSRQTIIGAAALAEDAYDTPASTLRQNVTSPGGTTEAALKILMSDHNGLTVLMSDAILAAKKRSEEL